MRYGARIWRKIRATLGRSILGTITHVVTREPVVALTFDDGPHPEFTPRLLEILERHGAHATFFMLGESVQKYPELVQRVADGGHTIGNHSWDHPSFPLLTGRERREQMRACAAAIAPYGGQRLFRPPYGHQSVASRFDALLLGHRVVIWNVVAEDWWDRKSTWMAERLVRQIRSGSVVALHDTIYRSVQAVPQYDRTPMLEAVDMVLEQLGDCFRFITIPELLQRGRAQRKQWYFGPSEDLLERLNEHPLLARRLASHRCHIR